MRVALKIFMRTVTLFCVGGTAFLIIRESKITTRVGGAKPWRWGVVCSLFFGGRMILNWLMDLMKCVVRHDLNDLLNDRDWFFEHAMPDGTGELVALLDKMALLSLEN